MIKSLKQIREVIEVSNFGDGDFIGDFKYNLLNFIGGIKCLEK